MRTMQREKEKERDKTGEREISKERESETSYMGKAMAVFH